MIMLSLMSKESGFCAQWKTLHCALTADSILQCYSLEWTGHPIKLPMQPVLNPNILYKKPLLGISLEGGGGYSHI